MSWLAHGSIVTPSIRKTGSSDESVELSISPGSSFDSADRSIRATASYDSVEGRSIRPSSSYNSTSSRSKKVTRKSAKQARQMKIAEYKTKKLRDEESGIVAQGGGALKSPTQYTQANYRVRGGKTGFEVLPEIV